MTVYDIARAIATQDNRATAHPYIICLQEQVERFTNPGNGDEKRYWCHHHCHSYHSKEEFKKSLGIDYVLHFLRQGGDPERQVRTGRAADRPRVRVLYLPHLYAGVFAAPVQRRRSAGLAARHGPQCVLLSGPDAEHQGEHRRRKI